MKRQNKNNLVVLFLISVYNLVLFSQESQKPIHLQVTFPAQNDTFSVDKLRISGNTDPSAIVTINNKKINVFPTGAFVTRVDLADNMNYISIKASRGGEFAEQVLSIFRPEKLKDSPVEPTQFDPKVIDPQEDLWTMNGDYFSVRCKGSPGGKLYFSIDKFLKKVQMIELSPDMADGFTGVYHGVVKLQNLPVNKPLTIIYTLTGRDNKKVTITAPGKLYILSEKYPIIGVTTETVYLHSSSSTFLPLGRLPGDISVHVMGRIDDRYKIKLGETLTAYIEKEKLRLLPLGSPLPKALISAPQISFDQNWIYLTMPINRCVPFITHYDTEQKRIELNVYGAQQASHWITYPNTAVEINNLTMQQIEEFVFRLNVSTDQKKSWGYKVNYINNSLLLSVRREPEISKTAPVKNLSFVIDPGHGGEEKGAISPGGQFEKDINLKWAFYLSDILEKNGAQVRLTRMDDHAVSLEQRIRIAEEANALFFISLHNNSTTPSGDALRAQGTSTYFTLAQNKELNWSIYPHLVKLGFAPYGKIYNSYYITNSTGFLAVLVEGGFLSHPEEELKLANDTFLKRMAEAVYSGIVDFLGSN